MKNNLFFLFAFLFLLGCSHSGSKHKTTATLATFESDEGSFYQEAFSGLFFEKTDAAGNYIFWSHSDRGPNADSFKDEKTQLIHRPFAEPGFQPYLMRFLYDPRSNRISQVKKIGLVSKDGKPLTGLPNTRKSEKRTGDEKPVDLKNRPLPYDVTGIDPEGICIQANHFWMADEYGPSLLKVSRYGTLLKRYFPGERGLASKLLLRRLNRGFEGIACAQGKIYLALQSPLPADGDKTLIIEFNPSLEKTESEYYYQFEAQADKIGDMVAADGGLYLIEQNSLVGEKSFHKVFFVEPSKPFSGKLLPKKLVIDLVDAGYDFADKVEGLAITPKRELFFINDVDFGLAGPIDRARNKPVMDPKKKSVLGHVKLTE